MKTIKFNTGNNRFAYAYIVDELPKVGDHVSFVYDDEIVCSVFPVQEDCEQPNREVWNYAFYSLEIEDAENSEDIDFIYVAIERENNEDEEKPVLQISKVGIKSETFCTTWNGKLYCVDICEDADERSAWLYNVNCGVKSLMWGEKIEQTDRDDFLDMVFSNLPDYIEDYEEEYES